MTPLPTYDRRHPIPVHPKEAPPRISVTGNSRPTHRGHGNRPTALTLAFIIVAGILGGASVFAWDRTGPRDRSGSLADAIAQRDVARGEIATLNARLSDLRSRLSEARAEVTALEGSVSAAEAELGAMLGPALPDGKHFGALIAIGANQEPPRLVIDIQQWFTDQAAVDAAIEDGITVDPGINGYYIRNESPRWRTIEIDRAARVSLTVYPYGQIDDPQVVSLERFADLALDRSEYWITMEEGKVVSIEQQYIP